MAHEVVPLLDVPQHAENIRVLNMDLPGVDVERLQVDVTRLKRAMHWGSIAYLAMGSEQGESSTYTFGGVKQNLDGTMSATGAKIATKARVSDRASGDIEDGGRLGWRNTAIYFNSSALKEHDGPEEQKVKMIDRALRMSMIGDISESEITKRKAIQEVGFALGFISWNRLLDALNVPGGGDSELAFLEAWMLNSMPKPLWPLYTGFMSNATSFFDNPRDLKFRHSSMYSLKFDRVMLASRHLSRRIITQQQA